MWHYLWGHAVYHLVRWFPLNNRSKVFVLILVLTLLTLAPQLYVLTLNHSSRWCRYKLFEFLIVSIVFTIFLNGFCFLFATMAPVPRAVKIAFHVFGFTNLIIGLVHVILTSYAEECKKTTEGLYILSLILAILSGTSIGLFALVAPFWLLNRVSKNSVLDPYSRTGICYEPVKCCSCLWHI